MIQTTLGIDGMMCSMCEAHINDTIRREFAVKKVSSSHTKKQTVILSDAPLDGDKLREAVGKTGYTVLSVAAEPYEKKGFSLFRKK